MENTRDKHLRWINKLLFFLLTALGFSCSDEDVMPEEYGTPYAEYEVKGKVVTNTTGSPIPGIQVTVTSKPGILQEEGAVDTLDVLQTDQAGEFTFKSGFAETPFVFQAEDVDGEANGSYESTKAELYFYSDDFTGGDGRWNQGKAKKEITIRMKERANDGSDTH